MQSKKKEMRVEEERKGWGRGGRGGRGGEDGEMGGGWGICETFSPLQ
jgi:hypothetical protein